MSAHCGMLRLSVILLSGLVSLQFACGPTSPPGPSDPQYPENALDLSDTNNQTLTEIGERFRTLTAGGSTSQAAATLVAELQAGRPGLSSASLGSDGYTIFLKMTDGSPAMINTNTTAFVSTGGTQAPAAAAALRASRIAARKATEQLKAYAVSASLSCQGQIAPATAKTLIMNTAAISHPGTNAYIDELRDALIAEGWQPGDITIRTRQGDANRTFTPLSMLDLAGYDLVFITAQGCLVDPGDGVPHAYLQCCRAGTIADVMQPEQWLTIAGERNDGRLIRCQTVTEAGDFLNEVYARDDFLTEQMGVKAGSLVYFIAPNSWSVANGLAGREIGSSLGWEGSFSGRDGQLAVLGMLRRMTATNTWTTDVQAFESLVASGQGTSYGPGGVGALARLAQITGDFYLPAWAEFTVDVDHFPSTATQAQVGVSYAACPGGSLDFTMNAADSPDAGLLPAGEATVTVNALNSAGETVGTGLQRVPINGGLNEIRLATCNGTAKIHLGESPSEGENATARIRVEFVYPYEMDDAPQPVELNLADVSQWSKEIPAGRILVRAAALNATGRVVGERTRDAEIECDISPIGLCFGWVKLQSTKIAPNMTSIRVNSDSQQAPGPFTLASGGATNVYGLKVGEVIHFTALALDSGGNPVSSASQAVTVACGENVVDLDLTNYGIMVSASPTQIAADGMQSSLIVATLRYWQSGDTLAPTGDPVVGKSVQFGTTLGILNGVNPATTNSNGQAAVQLSSTEGGVATVTAYVSEDQRQNSVIVAIGETEQDMTLSLKFAPTFTTPVTNGLLEANVRHKDGTPAAGVPVRFRLAGGQMDLIGNLNSITIGSGTAAINLHSDVPAFALIEATVPGTTLIKRKLACLGVVVQVTPSVTTLDLDNDEVILTATASPDPTSIGLAAKCDWRLGRIKGRSIRGGAATAWARYNFDAIPNTTQARVSGGMEPDTTDRISAELSFLVDGEWSEGVSWTGSVVPATVSFYGSARTVVLKYESTQKELPYTNPKLYQASVQAYFPLDTPEGPVRYIVNNNKDNGTDPVPGNWRDGTNNLTNGCPNGCRFTVAADQYMGEQQPGAWVAEKLQEYQETFGHLTLNLYVP